MRVASNISTGRVLFNPMNNVSSRVSTHANTTSSLGASQKPLGVHWYPPRFGALINNDYGVEIRGHIGLNSHIPYVIGQELMMRHIQKSAAGDTNTSLKLYMDLAPGESLDFTNLMALSDALKLVPRPIDAIIQSSCGVDGLHTLMSVSGKRFMTSGAELYMGPAQFNRPAETSRDAKSTLRYYEEHLEDLTDLIQQRTGETNRQKIEDAFHASPTINALQALWFGTNGLIDGILVPGNQVITRQNLNQFFDNQPAVFDTPEKINAFLANRDNIILIKGRTPLSEFSPHTLPQKPVGTYQSRAKIVADADTKYSSPSRKRAANGKPEFFTFDTHSQQWSAYKPLPVVYPITQDSTITGRSVEFLGKDSLINPGILGRDALFFSTWFHAGAMKQLKDGLLMLDNKYDTAVNAKATGNGEANIVIVTNTPGGYLDSGFELRDHIQSLSRPVDVLVVGEAASCGAFLLSSATGKRYASPNSRIMIHMVHDGGSTGLTARGLRQHVEFLDKATTDYSRIISLATGRPPELVKKDLQLVDVWLNPIEALFYGPKGMIDAIVTGPDTMITRKDVKKYLQNTYKLSSDEVDTYLEQKLQEKLAPELSRKKPLPKKLTEDPLEHPLKIIEAINAQNGRQISSLAGFRGSLISSPLDSLDYVHINDDGPEEE